MKKSRIWISVKIKAVLRILREDGLRKKIVAQGLEDVHNRFNARRVSEEHSKLFNKEMD